MPDYERWSRQMAIPEFGFDGQQRLIKSKTVVLGVGGVGCPAALYLAVAGVGSIMLVDSDRVELSNLNRQILFATSDIGKPKAEVAASKLRRIDPDLRIEAAFQDVREAGLESILNGCDFLLDCLDRNSDRLEVNRECVRLGIPATHGFAQDFSGEIFTVVPHESACLACAMDRSFPETESTPVLGAVTGLVGASMAASAIRYLTGIGDLTAGQRQIYDLAIPEMIKIPLRRSRNCPVCGSSNHFVSGKELV